MPANSGDPDQTPHSVASDMGLYCLPMSYIKDTRHIWVIINNCVFSSQHSTMASPIHLCTNLVMQMCVTSSIVLFAHALNEWFITINTVSKNNIHSVMIKFTYSYLQYRIEQK